MELAGIGAQWIQSAIREAFTIKFPLRSGWQQSQSNAAANSKTSRSSFAERTLPENWQNMDLTPLLRRL
jgi:hypothetical protein